MGKKTIKTIDLSQEKAESKALDKKKKAPKAEKVSQEKEPSLKAPKQEKQPKLRSKRYLALKAKVNKNKLHPLNEAVELLLELANSKIDETVEAHLSTQTPKLTGQVKLPYGTGKKQKIAIANESLIKKIGQGKIDFDILVASPKIMPQIAKVAKILGPKGLMPSPKTGTISDKPEELKKKLEQGETRFKTEAKAAVIHFSVGKISFGKEKLLANLKAFLKAVEIKNIKKAYLSSTHSPSIKLDLTNIK